MVQVYPIGIPVLYFFALWRKRELLNPRIYSASNNEEREGTGEDATEAGIVEGNNTPSVVQLTASNGQTKAYWSPQELKELDKRVKARTVHPELVPIMFLWRDFGEG